MPKVILHSEVAQFFDPAYIVAGYLGKLAVLVDEARTTPLRGRSQDYST
jgi:hypothetical protein